jgi:hypothetical protein
MSNKIISVQNIIDAYRKYAIEYGNSLIERGSDYKITNKAYKKIAKIFNQFRNDKTLADEILSKLILDDDIRVSAFAATHCLSLKTYVQKAEEILQKVSETKDIHLLSFNAEKTLEIWKKQGYLKL